MESKKLSGCADLQLCTLWCICLLIPAGLHTSDAVRPFLTINPLPPPKHEGSQVTRTGHLPAAFPLPTVQNPYPTLSVSHPLSSILPHVTTNLCCLMHAADFAVP